MRVLGPKCPSEQNIFLNVAETQLFCLPFSPSTGLCIFYTSRCSFPYSAQKVIIFREHVTKMQVIAYPKQHFIHANYTFQSIRVWRPLHHKSVQQSARRTKTILEAYHRSTTHVPCLPTMAVARPPRLFDTTPRLSNRHRGSTVIC